jgi:hypothetical protein
MGLIVKLQDEFGVVLEEIQDRKDLLGPYIPALRDETHHCLRFVDLSVSRCMHFVKPAA